MNKSIIIIIITFALLVTSYSSAQNTGKAYIENPQLNGLVFSWELHFERTNDWTPAFFTNALGRSAASFNFNTLGLASPSLMVEPGGPLDNLNYSGISVQIINGKCIVDIPFTLNQLAGTLPLNIKTKLLTVSMAIINTSVNADLSWDVLNTGFFDNTDATVITALEGGSNIPLPVELTSFTAAYKNSWVNLNWKTATEVNNAGFDVEKRVNEGEWSKIAFIQGHGNSNSPKEYNYSDKELFAGGSKFQYRLKQIDTDGQFEYSDVVEVEIVPNQYELSQNYPNPFNPSTTIRFSLPQTTQLKINIYNMLGELVRTIAEGTYEKGYHKVVVDAANLPSGTYVYRIESSDFVQVKKMILIK